MTNDELLRRHQSRGDGVSPLPSLDVASSAGAAAAAATILHSPVLPPSSPLLSPGKGETGFSAVFANLRLFAVVLSIGAASFFLVALDSVVDNLLPAAQPFLIQIYGNSEDADQAWEWIVSSRIYGLAVGCLLSILLANRASRKRPLIAALTVTFVGGVLSALVVHLPNYGVAAACVGRFLNGVGSGIADVIGSVAIAEISPIRFRGTALATLTVWACLGELLGMLLGLDDFMGTRELWHLALAVPNLLIPLALVCLWWAPDSPRSLLLAGDVDGARRALAFYQHPDNWTASMADFSSEFRSSPVVATKNGDLLAVDCEKTSIGRRLRDDQLWPTLRHRLGSRSFLRPFFVGAFTLTLVHLDDWLWISYSTQVFTNLGLSSSVATRASLLISFPQAIVSVLSLFVFDDFSRRSLIILPTAISILCSALAVAALKSLPLIGGVWAPHLAVPALAAVDLCAAAIASESAYAVVPELFQQRDRVLGTAIIGIIQNLFGGVLTTVLLTVINRFGTQFVLSPFLLLNVVYIVGIYKYLPETNGVSAANIAKRFHDSQEKKSASSTTGSHLRRLLSYSQRFYGRSRLLNVLIFFGQLAFLLSSLYLMFSVAGSVLVFLFF